MTLDDFSNGFDTLLNSFARDVVLEEPLSKLDIKLDEYEKSVYLTKSQEDIILSLYTGRNAALKGFEETEELRRYLASLVKEDSIDPISGGTVPTGMEANSKFFDLPSDLWFITFESVNISDATCEGMTSLEVVPVRQDEYHKIRKNPFRGPNNRRALRLDLGDDVVEIVSKYTVTKYYIRYLTKLKPIILTDLSDGLSIEGISTATPCEVHESLHRRILEQAVLMALQDRKIQAPQQSK